MMQYRMRYAEHEDYTAMYGSSKETVDADISGALELASSDVDVLTYNRIRNIGFDRLTEFQQTAVREVVCRMAHFRINHADTMESPYQSYSINGVSKTFGATQTIGVHRGIMMPESAYAKLVSTGLCCGVIG